MYADVHAWALVCPNYYQGDRCVSRMRYDIALDRDAPGGVAFVDKATWEEQKGSDPDPEDEDWLLHAYEERRRKLARMNRVYEPHEPTPDSLEAGMRGVGNFSTMGLLGEDPDRRPLGTRVFNRKAQVMHNKRKKEEKGA